MNKNPHLTWLLLATLLGSCQSMPVDAPAGADAGEQRVLNVVTSGGFASAYRVLAPQFEKDTGIKLVTAYGASSGGAPDSIPVRLQRGEQFDLIIMSQSSLNKLAELGEVRPNTRTDLVRSSIGMAVRKGATVPDISTPELFIESLLNAESIGYSASVSGTYLSSVLFPKLGLWEQLESKSKRIVSERVANVVARGEVAIGFQQISEIRPVAGIEFVGAIPQEYQKVTTFSTGITTRATNASDAQRLIDYFSSMQVAATIAATGLEPVAMGR